MLYVTGDYSKAFVDLSLNLLSRMEEGAFKSVLQDMSTNSGSLSVSESKYMIYQLFLKKNSWTIIIVKIRSFRLLFGSVPFSLARAG